MERFFVRGRVRPFAQLSMMLTLSLSQVFAMLWHENAGSRGTALSEVSQRTGPFHQEIISKTRRMVLLKKMHGFSWCMYGVSHCHTSLVEPCSTDAACHTVLFTPTTAKE